MASETQAYIDSVKAPELVGMQQVESAIKAFAAGGARVAAQVELWMQGLQEAEITEADPQVAALFSEVAQKYGALGREAREAQRHLRAVVAVLREINALNGRFRDAATAAGYTV